MKRSVARVHGDTNMGTSPQPSKEDLVLLIGQTNELIIMTTIMKQGKEVAVPAQEITALRAHSVMG